MSENFMITFYKIKKCGFYKTRTDKRQFGGIEETLRDLKNWATNVEMFAETKLLGNERTNNLGQEVRDVYYYDCCEKNKTFLLVLWNELLDIDGEVPTLSKEKKIGDNTECEMTILPENSIPGTAAYFWFIPAKNCFATIERKGRHSNVTGMKMYLENFLAHRSPHKVTDETPDEINIIGYRNKPDGTVVTDITAYFQAVRASKKGQIDYIKENRVKIRKIIRKQRILHDAQSRLTLGQNLLVAFGVKKIKSQTDEFNTSITLSYTPSKNELEEIIEKWEEDGLAAIDDTGFVLSADTTTHWLSGEISRIKKDWTIEYIDDEILKPQKLLEELVVEKDDLLAVLQE